MKNPKFNIGEMVTPILDDNCYFKTMIIGYEYDNDMEEYRYETTGDIIYYENQLEKN